MEPLAELSGSREESSVPGGYEGGILLILRWCSALLLVLLPVRALAGGVAVADFLAAGAVVEPGGADLQVSLPARGADPTDLPPL